MSEEDLKCWLCGRDFGRRVEKHHPIPKSKGGKATVPLHPICHKKVHTVFTNTQLASMDRDYDAVTANPDIAKFIRWVAKKPADFHAPTRRKK